MALGFTELLRFMPEKGGIRKVLVEVTGEASYTTNGAAVAASDFKLNAIKSILVNSQPAPLVDRQYIWDRANSKILAQVVSTAAQVAGAVNCSADKFTILVIGS